MSDAHRSALAGPSFYDDAGVFETYRRLRDNPESANDLLDRPRVRELIGDVEGLRLLDLGCGDAAFGRELLAEGAASYLGVDGSENMVGAARATLAGTHGAVVLADLATWARPFPSVDLAISRLALHYLRELDPLFLQVYDALAPSGRFVYSVEHPALTACDRESNDADEHRGGRLVDDYFRTGERVTRWMGEPVVKYHRTVEDHFDALRRAGFAVERVCESRPAREHVKDDASFERFMRVPLFLTLVGRKAASTA